MNKWLKGSLLVIGLLSAASVALNAQTKHAPAFQGDFTIHYKLPDGRVVSSSGHYYRNSRGLVREDNGSSAHIIDTNNHTVTLLNHESKTAVIYKVPAAELIPGPQPTRPQGPKTVPFAHGLMEGHALTKVRSVSPDGAKVEMWTADDLGFVVMRRTESGNMTTTKTFRNLKVAEPDASVFEIPRDYSISKQSVDPGVLLGRGRSNGRGRGGQPPPFDRR